MFTRLLLVGAALIASLAIFFASQQGGEVVIPHYIQGRNKTVLMVANQEHGLSNAHIATAYALLENYPDIEVHYASFPSKADKIARVSQYARKKNPAAKDIIFHPIAGPTFEDAAFADGRDIELLMHPPGFGGLGRFVRNLPYFVAPWDVESYYFIYKQVCDMIDEIDPAIIVMEALMLPGQDAAADKRRLRAMISPNTLVDTFLANQGLLKMLYKYPAFSSGFPFPVPLKNIPENIAMNFRFIYGFLTVPSLVEKRPFLAAKGLKDPIQFFEMAGPGIPWISMDTAGASIPLEVIPGNVTAAGPMVLSSAPVAEQDPELAAWLEKAPTVLINLGSYYTLTESQAVTLGLAIKEVIDKTGVQVLWKYMKRNDYSDDFRIPLQPYLDSGRLRASNWLTVDPTSILESGNVAAFVHHGGSNCYHEGVLSGVPQVILPMWADLYNFAALAETSNVGIWACKDNTPEWTVECLSSAFLELVDGGAPGIEMKEKAKRLGDKVSAGEKGRDISARVIAEWAYIK